MGIMIFWRWFLSSLLDVVLLLCGFWHIGAIVVSLFTRAQPDMDEATIPWGGWFGTWDNPPQGDAKHQREGLFPGATTGFKGYVMRVTWIWKNIGYNLQKKLGIPYHPDVIIQHIGDEHISDKYERQGFYLALATLGGKVIAWEFYCVLPWKFFKWIKCHRQRWGYKIMTDKFERYGFAPLVNTFNPFKSYGKG